ncbi:hypothetical protein B0H17DRAFT_335376 [Mycena rosella]|uniref:Secreted protein n=1 Tax=Mycena rosella TaxID=1033263 RepID=A0AAD7CRU0_MYCRO|nr:hypothetical protein B0H17DRAFT_335376 [Mycena rosella]
MQRLAMYSIFYLVILHTAPSDSERIAAAARLSNLDTLLCLSPCIQPTDPYCGRLCNSLPCIHLVHPSFQATQALLLHESKAEQATAQIAKAHQWQVANPARGIDAPDTGRKRRRAAGAQGRRLFRGRRRDRGVRDLLEPVHNNPRPLGAHEERAERGYTSH